MLFVLPLAADVRLGPEVPVLRDIVAGPAAYTQEGAAIASNGRDFLAVWRDTREQTVMPAIYASRLDTRGRALEPFGRKLLSAYSYELRLASNGDSYLMMWTEESRAFTQLLDEDGSPIGPARASPFFASDLESDGSGYLAAGYDPKESAMAVFSLDSTGAVVAKKSLQVTRGFSLTGLAAHDGRYSLVAVEQYCSGHCVAPRLFTIDDHAGSLTVTETTLTSLLSVAQEASIQVELTGERILFAWRGADEQTRFTIVDYAGNVLKPATALLLPVPSSKRVGWDGREFLFTALPGYGLLTAVRMRPDGSLASNEPDVLSKRAMTLPVFASNGDTTVLVWQEAATGARDLVTRAVHSFGELVNTPPALTLATSSGRAQHEVKIAHIGERVMAVWRNAEAREIVGAMDGVEISIDRPEGRLVGNPSVTAGRNRFLVAWFEFDGESMRLLAKRYTTDGTPFDDAPMIVATVYAIDSPGSTVSLDNAPGVAADGASFAMTIASPDIRLLRLDGDSGAVTELWRYACGDGVAACWGSFTPIRTATEWVVPVIRYFGFFSPHVETTWALVLIHMPLSGGGARMTQTFLTGNAAACMRAGIGQAKEQLTLTVAASSVYIAQKQPFETSIPRSVKVPKTESPANVAIAWNGSEYVLVWTARNAGPIRAMRLDVNGQPLDSEPFEIARQGSISQPSIAATDGGVIIVYSRPAPENGGAPRAFTRTLDALPPVPRRQAVRH